jgi:hypothetical protein
VCGNIKKLRFPDRPATETEIDAAVLQYLRKICDLRRPSGENEAAFAEARGLIAASVRDLLAGIKNRRAEATAKALEIRNWKFEA